MGNIVKCPHCNEVNNGSQLHCVKCQTSLAGLPQEQDASPISELVSPSVYENYYGKPLKPLVPRDETTTRFTAKKIRKFIGSVLSIIFVVSTPIALFKMILLQSESVIALMFSWIFFVIGLAIFLVPAETLLRFERQTGYFLYKLTPDEDLGLGCASTFYTLFGLVFMLVPVGISLFLLLFGDQAP